MFCQHKAFEITRVRCVSTTVSEEQRSDFRIFRGLVVVSKCTSCCCRVTSHHGDMNFYLDLPDDPLAKKFLNLLNEHGLTQHVTGPTHVCGHTLDVVITRDNSSILQSVLRVDSQYLYDSRGISFADHRGIYSSLHMSAMTTQRKSVSFRKLRNNELTEFCEDIESTIAQFSEIIQLNNSLKCAITKCVTF